MTGSTTLLEIRSAIRSKILQNSELNSRPNTEPLTGLPCKATIPDAYSRFEAFKLHLLGILLLLILPFTSLAQPATKKIKKRVVATLLRPEVDDDHIKALIDSHKDGIWPNIDYQDVTREGFLHRIHADNLLLLARAYRKKSSKFHKDEEVKKVLERALRHWVDHDYKSDNWWYNQIGIPRTFVGIMLLIGQELPKDLVEKSQTIISRANIEAQGARPGGDRIKIAGIEAKNKLFLEDGPGFGATIKVIEGEIKQVDWIGAEYGYGFLDTGKGFENRNSGGRGIQHDNSFHHRYDGVNNTLSYGIGYAEAFIEWATYTNNTGYAFSEEKLEALIDYFLDGICKTAIYGKFPDPGAKNRSISRPGALKPYPDLMVERLLDLSNYRKAELREISAIRKENIKPTLSHATFYRHSEHFTFQRPDFFTSVRMYSTRTHNMEVPYNSEGLLNHHRGDGANHISVTGDEYLDIWPVYDYQKIPGTTIVQKSELPAPKQIQTLGITDFVGAATDGAYAAVAFDHKNQTDTLAARKSWFFFDDAYVCLGAGISSDSDFPVVTTLNQALLRGDIMLSRQDNLTTLGRTDSEYEAVDWVLHDSIGYVFPSPTTVHLKNKKETGSWWRINKQKNISQAEVEQDVFALWIDHGDKPKNAVYEYIVVPATSVAALKNSSISEELAIVANTPYVQAVKNGKTGMVQAIFYKSGALQITENLTLTADTPGIFMLTLDDGKIRQISVADPNRELGRMHFSVSGKLEFDGKGYKAIWNPEEKISEIRVTLPQGMDAGKTVTFRP